MHDDKTKDEEEIKYKSHDKSTNVAIFFGGFSLTALTILISLNDKIPPSIFHPISGIDFEFYRQLLIGGLGLASTFFIVSIFGMKLVLVGRNRTYEWISRFSLWLYEAGFVVLLLLFPLYVIPFSREFGYMIIVVEGTWGILLLVNWMNFHHRK